MSKLRCILRQAFCQLRYMFILDQVEMGSTQVFQPTIGIEHYDEELFKRTLYVGNLSKSTSEYVIKEIFSVIGNVTDVKMITHEGQPDSPPYCFVTFDEHENALQALKAFNGRNIHAKPIKVNWATRPDGIRKDTSKDHHIFVGDLSPEVTTSELRKRFEHFGEISEARVVRDAQTNRSKGYGFVAFINKVHAEKAIKEMNKATIGGRDIRTNWATSKRVPQTTVSDPKAVAKASSEYNTTVYVGGVEKGRINDALLREQFSRFGPIDEVRLFEDKGYGFLKFQTHLAATQAICEMTGQMLNGCQLKCRWGKDDHKTFDMAGGIQNLKLDASSSTVQMNQMYPIPVQSYQSYQPYSQPYILHSNPANGAPPPQPPQGQGPVQYPYYYVPQQYYPMPWSNGENKEN